MIFRTLIDMGVFWHKKARTGSLTNRSTWSTSPNDDSPKAGLTNLNLSQQKPLHRTGLMIGVAN